MYGEARKLGIIENILKTNDDNILSEVESLLHIRWTKDPEENDVRAFSGIWSNDEANEIAKAIKENCENIHPNDWK